MDCVSVTSMLAVGVVSLLAYWIWKRQQLYKTFEKLGLSGPPPSWFMGNAMELSQKGLCLSYLEWSKKYGKCYGVYVPFPALVTSDPEMLREMMVKKFSAFPNRHANKFMDFEPLNKGLLQLENDHWRHVRNRLSPTFSSGKLKKMIPAIYRVVQNLDNFIKEKARTGVEVELRQVVGCFAMDSIAGAAFGLHVDSLTNPDDPFSVNGLAILKQNTWLLPLLILFPWMSPILNRLGITVIPSGPTRYFLSILEAALDDRRKDQKSHSDFLQLLVDAEKEGGAKGPVDAEINHSADLTTSGHWSGKGLTDVEIKGNALLFFFAGYETTSAAMSYTLFQLAANPAALKKAQDEVDEKLGKNPVRYDTAADLTYLDMCMNEAMRLNPPAFLLDRVANEDTTLGGYPIKKGLVVFAPIYTIHRDPDHWPEPEKFLPERHTPEAKAARHPFAFVPFGNGPRNCIGMRLAQLEIRMALATILQHYTPVLCDKSVYPPRLVIKQLKMAAEDGMWVKFQSRD